MSKKADYYYLDNEKDLLQQGDEFREPVHYRTKGAGVAWNTILDQRVGGKPCNECDYRALLTFSAIVFSITTVLIKLRKKE